MRRGGHGLDLHGPLQRLLCAKREAKVHPPLSLKDPQPRLSESRPRPGA